MQRCSNPTIGTWAVTRALNTYRQICNMVLVPNGKVWAAGGVGIGEMNLASAQLYDSIAGTWACTGTLTMIRVSF